MSRLIREKKTHIKVREQDVGMTSWSVKFRLLLSHPVLDFLQLWRGKIQNYTFRNKMKDLITEQAVSTDGFGFIMRSNNSPSMILQTPGRLTEDILGQ